MNENQMTPEQILAMMNRLKQNGGTQQQTQSALVEQLLQKMAPAQKEQLARLLRDKEAVQQMMQSEQAEQIMKRFHWNSE